MFNLVKAEMLKQKRRFIVKLVFLVPLTTILLALVMMAGNYLQDASFNWWYTILLPGSFTIFTALTVSSERRKNRHGLFGVILQKKQLWYAQMAVCILFLFASCLVFFLMITAACFMFGISISINRSAVASFLLFVTFAWQVPLWMAVTEKLGKYIAILLSLLCNLGIAVIIAVEDIWWLAFSIPARLMCPVLFVLPNGLPVEKNSALASSSVILPGLLISLLLLVVCSTLTALWFEKREV